MAKPGTLCRLVKGKMIDAQEGFVDTFNWMVDFINNLRGDGKHIELTNPTGSNPVVRFSKKANDETDSGIDVSIIDVDSGEPTTTSGVTSLAVESASDSKVTLALSGSDGNATLTIGVHYAD